MALGVSLVSTGGLAALFALLDGGSGTQLQAATIVGAAQPNVRSTAATVPALVPTPTVVNLTPTPAAATASPAAVPATVPATAAPATAAPVVVPVADVVVQGGVFHNKWGDVQVQATFAADGTLADVITLQTPSRDGKSVRINDRAVPTLNAEALGMQSASVDTVSGATYTSNDYRRSLQSAIDAARLAGITAIA